MKKIIIFYPEDFNCYSKFRRKLIQITKKIPAYFLCHCSEADDCRGFTLAVSEELEGCQGVEKKVDWQSDDVTHAIFFDDGECFSKEISFFNDKKKPFRIVKIKVTRVININREVAYQGLKSTDRYEYIGRGSYWGNPHSMYDSAVDEERDDREEVIRKFKYDFDFDKFPNKKQFKESCLDLAGKRLGCFCKPYACHGDVIANYLNSLDDGG